MRYFSIIKTQNFNVFYFNLKKTPIFNENRFFYEKSKNRYKNEKNSFF